MNSTLGYLKSQTVRISSVGLIFVTLFCTYGYFFNGPGNNGWSRMDLVRALVEDRTTRIDRFHENTNDKSYYEGHYYSDKAPGVAFLAVPTYAVYFGWLKARLGPSEALKARLGGLGGLEDRRRADTYSYEGLYLSTLTAIVFPSAVAVTFFFVVATELVEDRNKALLATAALGLGSLAFPYSTVLFGHQLSGALLFISFGLLVRERRRVHSFNLRWRRWPVVISGLAAGYAVITEFPAAVPLLVVAIYAMWVQSNRRVILPFVLGTILPAVLLVGYNWVSFDSPFALGYSHLASPKFAEEMRQGFFGLTYPKPTVLFEVLFGFYRGLLPLCPVLILSIIGFHRLWSQRFLRPELAVCAAISTFYLLLNASYVSWDGGWSLGPRHLVPMLFFLALPMAFGLGGRLVLPALLLLVSIGNMLIGSALGPVVPTSYANPLLDYLYRQFITGHVFALNLGVLLGLHGRGSLLPLVVLWLAAAVLLIRPRSFFGSGSKPGVSTP